MELSSLRHEDSAVGVDPYSLVGAYCLVYDGGLPSAQTISIDTVRLVVVTGVMGGPIMGGKRPRSDEPNNFKFDCQSPEAAPWGVLDCVARWHADQLITPRSSSKVEVYNTSDNPLYEDDASVDLLESVNEGLCEQDVSKYSNITLVTSSPLDPIQRGQVRGWGGSVPLSVLCPTYIGTSIPVVATSVRYGAAVCSYQVVAVVVPMGHPLQISMSVTQTPHHSPQTNFHFTSASHKRASNETSSFDIAPSALGDEHVKQEHLDEDGGEGDRSDGFHSWLEVAESLLMDIAHVSILQARASLMVPIDLCGPRPWYTAMWEAATSVRGLVLGDIRRPPTTGGIMTPFGNNTGPRTTTAHPHVVFIAPARGDAVRAWSTLLRDVIAPRIFSNTNGLVHLNIGDDQLSSPGVGLVVVVQGEGDVATRPLPTPAYSGQTQALLTGISTFADVAYWALCYGNVPVSVSWGLRSRHQTRSDDDGVLVVEGIQKLVTHSPTLSTKDDSITASSSSFLVPCTEEEQHAYLNGWSTRSQVLGCLPLAPLIEYPEVLPLDDSLSSSTARRPGILERTCAKVTSCSSPSHTLVSNIKVEPMMRDMDDDAEEDDYTVRPPPGATTGRLAATIKETRSTASAALAASLIFLDSCGGGGEPKMKWLDALSTGFLGRVSRYGGTFGGERSRHSNCMLNPGPPTSKLSSVLFPTPPSRTIPTATPSPRVLVLVGAQQNRGVGSLLEDIRDVFHPLGTLDATSATSLLRHLPTWESMGGVLLTSVDALVGATSSAEEHCCGDVQGYMWEWALSIVRDDLSPHMDLTRGLLLRVCAASDGMVITSALAYVTVQKCNANIHTNLESIRPILTIMNEQEWRLRYLCGGGGLKRPLTSITALWSPDLDPLLVSTVYRHLDLTDRASRPFSGRDAMALGDNDEAGAIRDALEGVDTTRYYLTLRQRLQGGRLDTCSPTERWGIKALVETAILGRIAV